MQEFTPRLTDILVAWQNGDPDAVSELAYFVSTDLRRMAQRYLGKEHLPNILQPTVLVNELFIHLVSREKVQWKNRAHFFGYAARVMQRFLTDHARQRNRIKNGRGIPPAPLGPEHENGLTQMPEVNEDVLAIHETVEQLAELDPEAADIVRLRYFVGMTVDEIAVALDRSPATVKRSWRFARRWLAKGLRPSDFSEPDPEPV